MKSYDAIVVGCGAMGASASYNLTKRGLKVLTVERFSLNHRFGSSHGETRIIRLAYFEDTRYVPLLRRSLDSWRELQAAGGRELLSMTGGLMVGERDGELITGVLKSAEANSIPHRVLSAKEAMDEFGAFRLGEEFTAVHDPNSGILFPERCISSFVDLGKQGGGEFRFNEPVTRWDKRNGGFEVETSAETYSADRVVICAGAWAGKLLPGLVPLEAERQVLFWFDPAGEKAFTRGGLPVFILQDAGGHYFYGIPDVGEGVKVARHHEGAAVDPDFVDRNVGEADSAPVEEFVAKHLPSLKGPPVASDVCLYANTPDRNFVVDFHPEEKGIVLVSACSGHGFKFASVIGEVVSDLAVEGRTAHELFFLRLGRFTGA